MNFVHYALKAMAPRARAFEKATKDPIKTQKKVLFEFLKRNKNTEYARKHNFSKIKSIHDYQSLIPLTNYETLYPYIERMTNGEKGVLTADKPVLFGVTSGTTGKPKFLPITNYSRSKKAQVMGLWTYYISKDHPRMLEGKILVIVSPEVEGYTKSGLPYGAESGHGYKNIPAAIRSLYVLPYEVFEIEDYESKYYCMLRIAIEQDVTTVATLNPSTIILLCQKISKFKDRIIEDIEKGALSKDIDIPEPIRKVIEKKLKPNPRRAKELRRILEEKRELLPRHFWPNMELVETWKGGTVGMYLKELPKYFGGIPVRDFGYLSSEARGSIPMNNEGSDGILAVSGNFYEFIPKEDFGKKDKRMLLCDQLEKGKEYFIVLTTPGGLYRYDIDDVIRVTGFFNKTPRIEFVQKGLNVSSVTGEKLYESQVVEAVKNASDEHKLSVNFFTAAVQWGKVPCYTFLVEFAEKPTAEKKKDLLCSIETHLCRMNIEYKNKRKSQRLKHPVLKVVCCGDFEKFKVKKVKDGAHDGQFKPPQLTCDLSFQENFNIEEEISLD